LWESQKERDHREDLDLCVDNNKMALREIGWGGMDCIDLAQDRAKWRAFLNMAINFQVP
jgi:hypothetical protein